MGGPCAAPVQPRGRRFRSRPKSKNTFCGSARCRLFRADVSYAQQRRHELGKQTSNGILRHPISPWLGPGFLTILRKTRRRHPPRVNQRRRFARPGPDPARGCAARLFPPVQRWRRPASGGCSPEFARWRASSKSARILDQILWIEAAAAG